MIWVAFAAIALLALSAWLYRGAIRGILVDAAKPPLPPAQQYHPTIIIPPTADTSTTRTTQPSSAAADPLAWNTVLPASVNLAVPFTSQAPLGIWDAVHEETCEEASAIMVDAYYHGQTAKIPPNEAELALQNLVAFEMKLFGFYKDTSAAQTAQFIQQYFAYKTVSVRPLTGADDIKRALAHGYPVIVPAYGKALGNPNFTNGGPLYHMLVVKGYTADGKWITNDPGTRLGANYLYSTSVLLAAAHDWNNGDVPNGAKVMIVVIPNP